MNRILQSSMLLLGAALFVGATPVNGRAEAQQPVTRHVREVTRNGAAQTVGRLSAAKTMQLDLVLQLRDRPGLQRFLGELYDPTSSSYRHFVTPTEFTERFGPTREDYAAVLRFAAQNRLTVTGGSRDGMEVQVKGTVAAIESAFHITLRTYQHPTEDRIFFAPDREPTPDLPFALWHVSGLDNYSIPHPLYVKKSDYAKAHGIAPDAVVSHATTGSGPSSSFLGSDMRAAYYGGSALTGAGQNLGLFEYAGTDLADLTTYFSNTGQTNNVPITLVSTDGTSTSCTYSTRPKCDDGEQTLDMTQAIGMAPGLSSLVMYVGSLDTAIISEMTTYSPLPTTIGCSWGWTPADPSTLDPYFEKMSAQGQNFFAASGDSSTWSKTNEAWPADDAYVISVGGTDLTTAKAAGAWASETAWVDSGGGITPDSIAIPAYQSQPGVINSSNKGSTTLRNGPDVSANANFTFYVCEDQDGCTANEYGGTSFAAPMWAAYVALVNQQRAINGEGTLGFINPAVYTIGVGSSYGTDFHDISSGKSGSYSAVAGYDLVTGWGSPNSGLLAALAGGTTQTPEFSLSANPTTVSVAQGGSGSSSVTSSVSGGFDSAVALSASGQPSGVTVGFSPTSIAAPGSGSSTVTFTVASSTTAGTYPITISGTGGGLTETTIINLTVTGTTPAFSVSASPSSITVDRGESGTYTITTSVTGGFDSSVALTATGEGTAQTATFSPSTIAAPGSGTSTLTIKVGKSAAVGAKTITITAKSGSTSHTTTVTLNIAK